MSRLHHNVKLIGLSVLLAWFGMLSMPTHGGQRIFFDRLSLEQGLSQSNIFDIHEDRDGFLWMATDAAADRFDGYRIESFRHDPGNPNTLTAGPVHGLHTGPRGNLWVLTAQGVAHLELDTLKITRALEIEPRQGTPLLSGFEGLTNFCDQHVISLFSEQAWAIDVSTLQTKPIPFNGVDASTRLGPPMVDHAGQVWVTNGRDLWVSDCTNQTFEHRASRKGFGRTADYGISLLTVTNAGHLAWAGVDGIVLFDPSTGQRVTEILPTNHGHRNDEVLSIGTDPIGGLWLLTPESLVRVELNDDGTAVSQWVNQTGHTLRLDLFENQPSMKIVQSGDGLIWVAASNLLGSYNQRDGTFSSYTNDPTDPQSLPPTSGWVGYELYADRFGVVWIGAKLGGVARYVPQRHRFEHLRDPSKPAFVVRGVAEERTNNQRFVWVGLEDSGLQLWQRTTEGRFDPVPISLRGQHQDVDISQLQVRAMVTHPQSGEVWFQTTRWIGSADASTQSIALVAPQPPQHTRFRALAFSPDGRFLYQNTGRTLIEHRFNTEDELISSQTLNWLPEKIANLRIGAITVLTGGAVLLAAEDRLFVTRPWDQSLQELDVFSTLTDQGSTRVISMLPIDQSRLLLGTADYGLVEVQITESEQQWQAEITTQWSLPEGLADVTVYAIVRDGAGRIWVSTNRGLSRIDPTTTQILNFGLNDGLQAYEFNTRVVHQTPFDEIYFGGINGVNVFQPRRVEPHPTAPLVHLQTMQINQQPVMVEANQHWAHDQNNWVFEFVGIHSVAPENNQFAFQLEGLDPGWVPAGKERIARYTGLGPGNYRFWVRSANGDGIWSEPTLLYAGRIAPPAWASTWAYVAYVGLAFLLMLAFVYRSRYRRLELQRLVDQRTEELRQKNELVTKQSHALQEALNARTLFFANVSHELRTPLTLIEANLSDIEKALPKSESIDIARRYLKRLVRLVDQLLDLSKIRIQGVQTQNNPWSLNELIDTSLKAYQTIAKAKGITLGHDLSNQWMTRIDPASAEKILLNLLTNAIKFTPDQGRVEVSLEADLDAGVWLRVHDTGPGIPEAEQALVFERFHRIPIHEAQRISGAGIGLALVSEAVAAIGGTIELDSTPGQGSTFSVWLPADRQVNTDPSLSSPSALAPSHQGASPFTEPDTPPSSHSGAPQGSQIQHPSLGQLLIVEDNEDLLAYLKKQLSKDWSVITARDGLEALEQLKHHEVDVILSDIMMPNMDGLGLLSHVRDALATSHIPFLFLTARGDDETELQSLMLSADDFLRKPFDGRILELKLKNVLETRRRLQTHLEHNTDPNRDNENHLATNLSPRDHRFVERLTGQLESHFSDTELSVAGLASSLAVDERTLQRKIRALYGQTPAHFINEYRIRKACELLKDPSLDIQEVAYQCGYNSARYFSRVFQKHRKQSPSQWRLAQQSGTLSAL